MNSNINDIFFTNPRASRIKGDAKDVENKYTFSDYSSYNSITDKIIFSFFHLKNTAKWKIENRQRRDFKRIIIRYSEDQRQNSTKDLVLNPIEKTFVSANQLKKEDLKIYNSEDINFSLILFKEEESITDYQTFPITIKFGDFKHLTGIMLFLVDDNLKYNLVLKSEDDSLKTQIENESNQTVNNMNEIDFPSFTEDFYHIRNLFKELKKDYSNIQQYPIYFFGLQTNFKNYENALALSDLIIKIKCKLSKEYARVYDSFNLSIQNKSNPVQYYKKSIILQIKSLKNKMLRACTLFFENNFIKEMEKFFEFNEFLKKIEKCKINLSTVSNLCSHIELYYSSYVNSDILRNKPKSKNDLLKINGFINELKKFAFINLNETMKSLYDEVEKSNRTNHQLISFCKSFQILLNSDILKILENLYPENLMMYLKDILHIKFNLYSIDFNIRSIFFGANNFTIKPNFILFTGGKNNNYPEESEIISAAIEKLTKLFNNLDEGDDLFNYLSFLNYDPRKSGNEFHDFLFLNDNFEFLKKLLKEELIFENYVLFEYEIIEIPISGKFSETEEEKIIEEMDNKLSFVNNEYLYHVCCINKRILLKDPQKEFRISKCFLYTLHEIVHLMLYKQIEELMLLELKSANMDELKYQDKSSDSGDKLEILMADQLINKFVCENSPSYTKKFYEELDDIKNYKNDLIGFITLLKNRKDYASSKEIKRVKSSIFSKRPNLSELDQQLNFNNNSLSLGSDKNLTKKHSFDFEINKTEAEGLLNNELNSYPIERLIEESKSFESNLGKYNHISSDNSNGSDAKEYIQLLDSSKHFHHEQSIYEFKSEEDMYFKNFPKKRRENQKDESFKSLKSSINVKDGDKNHNSTQLTLKDNNKIFSENEEEDEFLLFMESFEEYYHLRLEEYFPLFPKSIILRILYSACLRLRDNYTRKQLFFHIFNNIKRKLDIIKKKYCKFKRLLDHPRIILKINSILEMIYQKKNK